jgi:hypothetical protein
VKRKRAVEEGRTRLRSDSKVLNKGKGKVVPVL